MNKKMIFPAIMFGIISSAIFLIITNEYHMAISFDSVRYISQARNLLLGEGALDFFNRYNADQPLFFPVLLSLIGFIVGVDPLEASWILGVIVVGLISSISSLFLFYYLENTWLKYLGSFLIMLFLPSSKVIFWAWTEPLFIFLTLMFLFFIERYLKTGTLTNFLLLCAFAGLAMVTRYIGVILIPLGVFAILAFCKISLWKRLIKAVEYSFLALLPLGINLTVNFIITKTFFGTRSPSVFTFKENLSFVSETLFNWFLPNFIAGHRSALLVYGIFVGIVLMKEFSKENILESSFFQKSRLIILYIFFYIGFLVYSATTTAFDRISTRLLSPVFVPILLVVLIFLGNLFEEFKWGKKSQMWIVSLAIVVFIIFSISAFQNSPKEVEKIYKNGDGFSSERWRNSELVSFLGSEDLENCEWYTNGPEAIYFFTGKNAKWVLHKGKYNSPVKIHEVDNWTGKWPSVGEEACVIWFNTIKRSYLFTPEDLSKISTLEREINLRDGSVFFFTRKK